MKPPFRKKFEKLIILLLIGFVTLFLFRLIYGYQSIPEIIPTSMNFEVSENILGVRKNYASKKYKIAAGQATVRMDQKYEKIADIRSTSTRFEKEEEQIRKQIENYKGLIQFESKNGNDGYRNLNLVIGVPPESFDSIYARLIKIGNVQTKQITKTDKTNEYKELNAKKTSLEKSRLSLIALKAKGGMIEEYIQLENRILAIEEQLQELGVSLGNFDDENEFCTVKFSLSEKKKITIGFLQRVKVALEWTIKTYFMVMATFTFMSLFAYLMILSIEKIKTKTE